MAASLIVGHRIQDFRFDLNRGPGAILGSADIVAVGTPKVT
jgi:hypothetical protein